MIGALLTKYRLYAELLGVLILLLLFWWFVHHQRVLGAQQCVNAGEQAVQRQKDADDLQLHSDLKTVSTLNEDYRNATAHPVTDAPVARLCVSPSPVRVPAASSATGSAHAAPELRTEPAGGPDIGTAVVTEGRNADAQVAGLLRYIKDVCRPAPTSP